MTVTPYKAVNSYAPPKPSAVYATPTSAAYKAASYTTKTAGYPVATPQMYDSNINIYPSSFVRTELSVLAVLIALVFQF